MITTLACIVGFLYVIIKVIPMIFTSESAQPQQQAHIPPRVMPPPAQPQRMPSERRITCRGCGAGLSINPICIWCKTDNR